MSEHRITGRSTELEALCVVAEAARRVAEYDQVYEKHEDDSSEDGPSVCTICGEKGDRMFALDDALAALDEVRRA